MYTTQATIRDYDDAWRSTKIETFECHLRLTAAEYWQLRIDGVLHADQSDHTAICNGHVFAYDNMFRLSTGHGYDYEFVESIGTKVTGCRNQDLIYVQLPFKEIQQTISECEQRLQELTQIVAAYGERVAE